MTGYMVPSCQLKLNHDNITQIPSTSSRQDLTIWLVWHTGHTRDLGQILDSVIPWIRITEANMGISYVQPLHAGQPLIYFNYYVMPDGLQAFVKGKLLCSALW